jgi:hypothetical protein
MPYSLLLIQDKPEFPNPKEINDYKDFKEFLLEKFQD